MLRKGRLAGMKQLAHALFLCALFLFDSFVKAREQSAEDSRKSYKPKSNDDSLPDSSKISNFGPFCTLIFSALSLLGKCQIFSRFVRVFFMLTTGHLLLF